MTGHRDDVATDAMCTLVRRLRRIPDSAREFTISGQQAWTHYRVAPETLHAARDLGLPASVGGGAVRYEVCDVMNLAMYLGVGATAMAARRCWTLGMNRSSPGGTSCFDVSYLVDPCLEGAHEGDCRYRFVLPRDRESVQTVPCGTAPQSTIRIELENRWPELPAWAREICDITNGIHFMRLPPSIREDLGFVTESRLGDCVSTARLLCREGKRGGRPVRFARGLLVVVPFSAVHNWAEFKVGDRWVPADPVLIDAMCAWGVLDPGEWSRYRSPGAALGAISASRRPLACHGDDPVPVSFPTRSVR